MYNIVISDRKEFLRHIPEKQRYEILFYSGHSVTFSNKRDAFAFISKVSSFLSETLHLLEMFHHSLSVYKSLLDTNTPNNSDVVNIYHNNDIAVFQSIKEIKCFKWKRKEMYKIIKEFDLLFLNLKNNVNIICKKVNKNTNHLKHFITKLASHFFAIIQNIKALHENNNITLFIS